MPIVLGLGVCAHAAGVDTEAPPELMSPGDVIAVEAAAPDARISYGDDALQFAELRVPDGAGPHPVAIMIHGGCWLARYDLAFINRISAALTDHGIATWTLEYRRVGDEGGGWPGTFEDIARGADHLHSVAGEYSLDLSRVIVAGHSAGGHLALWLAARQGFKTGSFRADEAIELKGVLALAAAADLAYLDEREVCGDVIDQLMGGSPEEVPERYAMGSAVELVPIGLPQIVLNGAHDADWTPVAMRYYEAAVAAGDDVELIEAPDSGHFEMVVPYTTTWPLVLDAARRLLGIEAR